MEVLICQSCGTVLRGKSKNCAGCGLIVSTHSPTTAPTLTNTNQALSVAVRPDPVVLEKVLAKRAAGIDVYSKSYSLGGAYSSGSSSFGGSGNSNGHDNGNGNGNGSSSYDYAEQSSATAPASFFDTTPREPVIPSENFDTAPANNNAFSFAPGNSSTEIQPAPDEPEVAPVVTAPQSAFMSNQTFEQPQTVEATASSAKPDFFASSPVPTPAAPAATPEQNASADPQQKQSLSGSQTTLTHSRAQQSLSGAQPPPLTTGQHRALDPHSTMPPVSAPATEPVAAENSVAPEAKNTTPHSAKVAPPVEEEEEDDYEEPRSAAQMDFFAASSAPGNSSKKEDSSLARSQKSSARDEAAPFADPDTRKFTRSKNKDKEKVERLVEAPDENFSERDSKDSAEKSKKNKKEVKDDFDFDSPKKSKTNLASLRKKIQDEDDDDDSTVILKKSPKPKKSSRRDDDDDDDDDEDFAPPRRSFSGNSPSLSKKPIAKRGRKIVDEDDDDDEDDDQDDDDDRSSRRNGRLKSRFEEDDEEDEEDETSPPYVRFLKKPVRFLGFSMPRHMQLVVIGVFLVIVPMLIGFTGAVLTATGDLMKGLAPQEKMPLLTGDWQMHVMDNGKPFKCDIELQQIGDNFYAQGSDFKPFYIVGRIVKPDHIQFNKLYRTADGSFDKPIEYNGDFDLTQDKPYAKGFWRLEKRQGAFYKAHTVVFSGQWDMKQTRVRSHVSVPLPEGTQVTQSNVPLGGGGGGGLGGSKKPFWQSCFEVAGFLLVGSIVLVVLVWKSFGTNGALSIMGKRQYIPSQYKGDHNKILNVLAKPQRPGSMPLGQRNEWKPFLPWVKKDLCLPPEIRRKDPHMLLLGAGDKGKSRMIANLISADIESNDRAVVLIDSDGALVDLITRWISHHPKGRQFSKRVIILDPTYKHGSLAYNPLEMPEDEDLQAAASSLVYGFKAIYTEPPGSQSQWNQQTANILRNAALLLMANGKTLTDLPTLLQDNDFRDILLENIERKKKEKTEYITLLDTWGQYKKLARTDQWINWVEPILNRVGPMLSDPRIRPILTQAEGLKLTKVIQDKQILLVKIKKGHLDQNANLLGSLIVTGLKQAAMSISGQQKQKPVALYLDEFDNFIEKDTFESITSETDKFQIGLVGALRTLQHLPEDFRNNLIINVGTMACFALSKKDGDLLGPQMFRVDGRKIKHQTMSNFFNPVNTSPQFELISDEEKLNIDRVVGQDARNFYCYRVGSQAGVFHMKTHDFNDINDRDVNYKLIDKMHGGGKKAADNDD